MMRHATGAQCTFARGGCAWQVRQKGGTMGKFTSVGKQLAIAGALLLGACATSNTGIDVTRFHLDQPIPADAIMLVPPPGAPPFSLEYQSYADALTSDLAAAGLRRVANDTRSAYVGVLTIEQTRREGPRKPPKFQIGIGGGTGGRGGGIGGGVSLPVGRSESGAITVNSVSLQIKRRSDSTMVWEGRAVQEAGDTSLAAAMPALSHALLADFPGQSGQTVRVKAK
jgi:hypothetical protein